MINPFLFKLVQKYPFLSKLITATDGYIPDEENEKDYQFGANIIGKTVLRPDGQWTAFLPSEEYQSGLNTDTMACTCFSLLNVLEVLAKVKFNSDWNKSDRYSAKSTWVSRSGNTMRTVLDITRKTAGTVNEQSWSWDKAFTWNQYYANIPATIKQLGADWLKEYEINYESVWTNKQLMMEALKYSPLYVAGYAWYYRNGLYRNYARANHAFTIVGYVEGSHWLAFDSYSPFIKKLEWDYDFSACYVITLNSKKKEYSQSEINKLMSRGFKYIMRTDKYNGGKGELYELTENGLIELNEQKKLEIGVKSLADLKIMTGISELDFYKLVK